MKNLKTIGITTLVVIGIIFIGYSLKTSNVGSYSGSPFIKMATTKSVTATSSVEVLAGSTSRKYAIICNDSSNVVYINLNGSEPATSDVGLRLNANGGCYEINEDNLYIGAIQASSTNETSSKLIISEFK